MTDAWPLPLDECALAQAIEVFGDPHILLILREAFYGVTQFDRMHEDLGLSRASLSTKLRHVCRAGLFEKKPYKPEGKRTYYAYEITQKGRDLFPVLIAMRQWHLKHGGKVSSRLRIAHGECDGDINVRLHCSKGHEITDMSSFSLSATGPD